MKENKLFSFKQVTPSRDCKNVSVGKLLPTLDCTGMLKVLIKCHEKWYSLSQKDIEMYDRPDRLLQTNDDLYNLMYKGIVGYILSTLKQRKKKRMVQNMFVCFVCSILRQT